jgi:hypothetical protein
MAAKIHIRHNNQTITKQHSQFYCGFKMKNIYAQLEKFKKENLLLYSLIIVNVIGWGLLFYLKVADYLHDFGIEIGKAFAR